MSHFNFIFFTKGFHLFVDKFSTVVCKNFFGKSIGEAVALENLKCLVDGFIFQGCSINVLCVMIRNVHCPLMLLQSHWQFRKSLNRSPGELKISKIEEVYLPNLLDL